MTLKPLSWPQEVPQFLSTLRVITALSVPVLCARHQITFRWLSDATHPPSSRDVESVLCCAQRECSLSRMVRAARLGSAGTFHPAWQASLSALLLEISRRLASLSAGVRRGPLMRDLLI